jgi:hypothetical protein
VKPEMKSEMTIDLINDTAGRSQLCSTKKQRMAKYFDGDLYFGTVIKYFPAS